MTLSDVLAGHRVVVCVGSGGVGKTTSAAALALHAARSGQRVLCLTIDPARRLANSLGLREMTTDEQQIPPQIFAEQGVDCAGSLSAMMLDTKRTFDDIVVRFAPTPERAQRILANKLYQYVSTSLAGTQEYMAMEKLHAVRRDPRYDLIVLDTPPTSNALDFLDAPEKLTSTIDSPATRWFATAFETSGKLSLNLLGKGAAFLIRGLSNFTGAEFLDEVAHFVVELNALFGGFRERAKEVSDALRSPEVAFVVVTSPKPLAIDESLFLGERLRSSGMRCAAYVVNQIHPLHPEPQADRVTLERSAQDALPASIAPASAITRMRQALDDERLLAIADRVETERLKARGGKGPLYVEVPAFEEDVHDLRALARVAEFLTGAARAAIVEGG
jgi:anion-transporting  ArsA/GET3 family ATPase